MSFHSRLLRGSALGSAPHDIAAQLRLEDYTRDQFQTYDQATFDSAGAFLIGELERLDPTIHEPLISTTWSRDIDLRTDVQMGDTTTSYMLSSFGMTGGVTPAGIGWAGMETTTLPRAQLDLGKIVAPLNLWAGEVAYTVPELESARLLGRPIDVQMLAALNRKYQMDVDQLVYIGDATISQTGLVNSANVVNVSNVANGAGGSPLWSNKTPDEIKADINELIVSTWAASGYTSPPTKILLPPVPFGYITTTNVSEAGNSSILTYVKENNVLTAERGIPLEIVSAKWLDKTVRGAGSDRMMAYTQREDYVRFPLVPLQAVSVQYQGIWVKVPYYGRMGAIETVYPETMGYRDGIG